MSTPLQEATRFYLSSRALDDAADPSESRSAAKVVAYLVLAVCLSVMNLALLLWTLDEGLKSGSDMPWMPVVSCAVLTALVMKVTRRVRKILAQYAARNGAALELSQTSKEETREAHAD